MGWILHPKSKRSDIAENRKIDVKKFRILLGGKQSFPQDHMHSYNIKYCIEIVWR